MYRKNLFQLSKYFYLPTIYNKRTMNYNNNMNTMNKFKTLLMTALILTTGCTKYDDFSELNSVRIPAQWKYEEIETFNSCTNKETVLTYPTNIIINITKDDMVVSKNKIQINGLGMFDYTYNHTKLVLTSNNYINGCNIYEQITLIRLPK